MLKKWLNVKRIGWIIVFGVMLLFWIFQVKKKEDMHCDEYFSYMGANSSFEEEGFAFEDLTNGSWITPAYFAGKYSIDKDEIFHYAAVWKNQGLDVHPPLYYLFLHLASSFFLGRFSMIPGLLLNIICTILLLVIIYKTLFLLSGNEAMSLAATATYGVCVGVISTMVFIRMYALAALLVGFTVYLYAAFVHERIKNKTFLAGIFLTNLFGGLTHYYFLVFSVLTFTIFLLWQICLFIDKKQKIQMIVSYIVTNAASAVAYFFIWPSCIEHILHGYRGEEAFENAAQLDSFLGNIGSMFAQLDQGLWLNNGKLILILTCVIAVGMYLKGCWDRNLGLAFGMGIDAVVYFLLVAQVSPFKTDRYLMPIYPLIAIAIFSCLIIFLTYFERGAKVFLILMCLFALANAVHTPGYLYASHREKVSEVISQESENGLFVRKNYDWYQLAENSLYITQIENTKVVFDMGDPDLIRMDERLQTLSSLCVFFDSDYNEEGMIEYFGENLWDGHYTYTYLDAGAYCNIYLFEKERAVQ